MINFFFLKRHLLKTLSPSLFYTIYSSHFEEIAEDNFYVWKSLKLEVMSIHLCNFFAAHVTYFQMIVWMQLDMVYEKKISLEWE